MNYALTLYPTLITSLLNNEWYCIRIAEIKINKCSTEARNFTHTHCIQNGTFVYSIDIQLYTSCISCQHLTWIQFLQYRITFRHEDANYFSLEAAILSPLFALQTLQNYIILALYLKYLFFPIFIRKIKIYFSNISILYGEYN